MITGFFSHDVLNVTPKEALRLCEEHACLVDLREAYMSDFKMFGVKNLVYIPFSSLVSSYEQLPTEIPLIFADAVGLHSREAVKFMMEHGYENVANLAGGIVDWERDGLPVTTDKSLRLTGSCMCQLKPRERKHNKQEEKGG